MEEQQEKKRKLNSCDNEFQCDICLKVFKQHSSYTRHKLSHCTYFSCSVCGGKFRRKDYLQKHTKRTHQKGGALKTKNGSEIQTSNHEHFQTRAHQYSMDANHTSIPKQLLASNNHDHNETLSSRTPSIIDNDHDYVLPSRSTSLYQPINIEHDYASPSRSTNIL